MHLRAAHALWIGARWRDLEWVARIGATRCDAGRNDGKVGASRTGDELAVGQGARPLARRSGWISRAVGTAAESAGTHAGHHRNQRSCDERTAADAPNQQPINAVVGEPPHHL